MASDLLTGFGVRVMNHRLQLSPVSSTRESPKRLPINEPWGVQPANGEKRKFFRPWLVHESIVQTGPVPRRIRWNMVLGLALATAVSASIWAGVGLMIARVWK